MTNLSRALVIIACTLLATAFVFPLWQIHLFAPQYPEGLTMNIWLWKLSGELQSLNLLNHYVGMKPIVAEGIPELRYFPVALGALIILGIASALARHREILMAWCTLLLVSQAAALLDFYAWEYRYGHDLNPDAPIKMSGMSYQPPLIGSKELLNITAYSYPDIAGVAIALAAAISVYVIIREYRRKPGVDRPVETIHTS